MFTHATGSVNLFNHLGYSLSTPIEAKYVAVQYNHNSSLKRIPRRKEYIYMSTRLRTHDQIK